ncbi:MAG TPA: aminotransferase [Acholeplasmatales bacterium]|nr:aminotransferase [Acholeplasmatales bacterium]
MKQYDFDRLIDRRDTCSIKTDFVPTTDLLPLWIADMDFPVADEIVAAVKRRADHPIFGYGYLPDGLFRAFVEWHRARHGVVYDATKTIPYYSVVSAIRLVLAALTEPGDGVTIMTPAYMNFKPSVVDIDRTLVTSPLINVDGRYEIDFADLDRCLSRSRVLLACSPHNPVGRVWTRGELEHILALCERHDAILISDEIHSDLILPGFAHTPILTFGDIARQRSVVMLSATKTFNLAQTGMAFMYSENPVYEAKIRKMMGSLHLGAVNVFAAVMVQAAYEHGSDWLEQVLSYVHENERIVAERIGRTMPDIRISPLEGTYLLWVDCRRLGIPVSVFFEKEARIYGDDGALFGEGGEGFYRLNIATPRCVVADMLDRMEQAYHACMSRKEAKP